MATTITVLYENVDDLTFDMDYYLAKHMKLVDEKFTRFGLRGWQVLRAGDGLDGQRPKFAVIALLEFDEAQQFKDAVAAEGGPVFGDVPNFSNKHPVVVIGERLGSRAA